MSENVSIVAQLKQILADEKIERASLDRGDEESLSIDAAEELCDFLEEQFDVYPLIHPRFQAHATPLAKIAMLFQAEADEQTRELLGERGVPELRRLAAILTTVDDAPADPATFVAKILALYGDVEGADILAEIVRRYPDEFLHSITLNICGAEQNPLGPIVLASLTNPLPDGFAAVATLDLANTLARQERIESHPFNTPEGHGRLEAWLTASNPDEFSYAHSATASLPFLASSAAARLAALAFDHPDSRVQIEAAWASAYCGGEAGLKFLARAATDPRSSVMACGYLEELDKAEWIPAEARAPDFVAKAQMCDWLQHPSEFGDSPDEIDLYDTRELSWPPTDDVRQVWLFKYRYKGREADGSDTVGLGMVGSITFALFGETTADLSPEDAYGLHCCWELEMNEDTRAPEKRSAEAGRKLLGI